MRKNGDKNPCFEVLTYVYLNPENSITLHRDPHRGHGEVYLQKYKIISFLLSSESYTSSKIVSKYMGIIG